MTTLDNDFLKAFGEGLLTHADAHDERLPKHHSELSLEPGMTDRHGNKYADHEAYEAEMDKRGDSAIVKLQRPF